MYNNILVAIIHVPGRNDDNFNELKLLLGQFDIFIPQTGFYGNRWKEIKDFFLGGNYKSVFVICSDVRIVCGDIVGEIIKFSHDSTIGTFGFGTINNFTFPWLAFNNLELIRKVPFIEGYCFGANKELVEKLELNNTYGYGLDVEMGYKSHCNCLKCILSNVVCISHDFGKSYDNSIAKEEYHAYLNDNIDVHNFLKTLNIHEPIQ